MPQLLTERSVKFGCGTALVGGRAYIEVTLGILMGADGELRGTQEPFRSGCPLAARGVGFAAAAFKASSTTIRDRLLDCPTKFDCARMRIGERHGIAIAAAIMPKLAGRELIATVLLRSVHVRAWCDPSVRSVGLNVIVFD